MTPLHQALQSGNTENMRAYFDEVHAALDKHLITQHDYQSLLLRPNQAGLTPLHQALQSGNTKTMRAYFDEVRAALDKNFITRHDYQGLLLWPNQAGFTPLHQALQSGNTENMRAYFDEVRAALDEQLITQPHYQGLLLRPNRAGLTPLHQAADSGSLELLSEFLNTLKQILTKVQYHTALVAQTSNGFMPSCQPYKSDATAINERLNAERRQCASSYGSFFLVKDESRKRLADGEIDKDQEKNITIHRDGGI